MNFLNTVLEKSFIKNIEMIREFLDTQAKWAPLNLWIFQKWTEIR